MGLSSREEKPKVKFHKWDDVLNFGQFKGFTVREAAEENPQYLLWCIENIDWFDLDVDVYDELVDMLYPPDGEYDDYETDSFSIY